MKAPSKCVGLPVEECYLAKDCRWTKRSKTGRKEHCRIYPSWLQENGPHPALAEWRDFYSKFSSQHPELKGTGTLRTRASEAWHKQHGTVKKSGASAAKQNMNWRMNPSYEKKGKYPQYGGVTLADELAASMSPVDLALFAQQGKRFLEEQGMPVEDKGKSERKKHRKVKKGKSSLAEELSAGMSQDEMDDFLAQGRAFLATK